MYWSDAPLPMLENYQSRCRVHELQVAENGLCAGLPCGGASPCSGKGTNEADDLHVDLETVVRQKLVKNGAKYPVEKAKGVATKWDRL